MLQEVPVQIYQILVDWEIFGYVANLPPAIYFMFQFPFYVRRNSWFLYVCRLMHVSEAMVNVSTLTNSVKFLFNDLQRNTLQWGKSVDEDMMLALVQEPDWIRALF
jgi:hypothetical protein